MVEVLVMFQVHLVVDRIPKEKDGTDGHKNWSTGCVLPVEVSRLDARGGRDGEIQVRHILLMILRCCPTRYGRYPDTEKITPPLLQLNEVTFGYTPDKIILKGVNIDVGLDSRIAIVGPNGAGKSTLIKLLTGELKPLAGHQTRNGRLRVAYFAQHHVDTLTPTLSPVGFLASRFPGKSELEYRQHLGAFGITGLTGMQVISTLSGGQKSRVAFAALSLQMPHVLLLDEPTNHLDIEGLDALMHALHVWNGGVILISHDERFITKVASELWVCGEGTVKKYYGDVKAYKQLIVANIKGKP